MTEAEIVDAIQTELDGLIDRVEDDLGRSLTDDEYESLREEFLAALDDDDESDEEKE